MRTTGKVVTGLRQRGNGRWATAATLRREAAARRAERREEWARQHPCEALDLAMVDVLKLVLKLGGAR